MKYMLIVFVLCSVQVSLWAQVPVTQGPKSLAQQALRQSLGQAALPNDVLILGEQRQSDGSVVSVRIQIQGKRKVRYEIGSGRDMQVSIFSDGSGWVSEAGKFRPLQSQAGVHRPSVLPFLDLLSEVDQASAVVSDGGLRQVGSSAAYRVQIRVPDSHPERRFRRVPHDEQINVFIDPTTFLVVRSERILVSDTDLDFRVPAATEYSDYRNVQGFAVPFRVVNLVGTPHLGIRQTVLTIQSIVFNQGVSDSVFLPQ